MPFQELIADSEYKEAAMLCPKALWQTGPPGPSQAPSGEASAAPVEPPLPPPPPPPRAQPQPGLVVVVAGTPVPVPHPLLVARLLLTAWTRTSTLLELESLPRGGLQARHSSQGLFE